MKFFLSIFLLIIFLSMRNASFAQTATSSAKTAKTPSATPTENPVVQQINDLKDRIASRVAQLKLVERKGIIGTVTAVSDTQLTLADAADNSRFVDVDELTKFSSPSAKGSFGISDITKGTSLGILGLYNKQSQRLLARFVEIVLPPIILQGKVRSLDTEEFTIDILANDESIYTVDVETTTKMRTYTKEDGVLKLGFSKIPQDAHIFVAGFPSKTDSKRITADRIIVFPDITGAATPENKPAVLPTALPTLSPVSPSTKAKAR